VEESHPAIPFARKLRNAGCLGADGSAVGDTGAQDRELIRWPCRLVKGWQFGFPAIHPRDPFAAPD